MYRNKYMCINTNMCKYTWGHTHNSKNINIYIIVYVRVFMS